MSKAFFSVFKELENEDPGLSVVLRDAQILKITESSNKRRMKIYLLFNDLVPKDRINALERMISERVFKEHVSVTIVERYSLGDEFVPRQILSSYKDSILTELYQSDRILFQIVKQSNFSFNEDDRLSMSLPDDGTSELYEGQILKYFDDVFRNRFGSNISFDISYEKPARDHLKENRLKLELQSVAISEAISKREAVEIEKKEEKENKGFAKKEAPKEKKEKEYRTKKNSVSKKSENEPGLFYGRAVGDEYTKMIDIAEDTSEVALRGQVFFTEEKELRSGKILFTFSLYDGTDSISAKLFLEPEVRNTLAEEIKNGSFIALRGLISEDRFSKELAVERVYGIKKTDDFLNTEKRQDLSSEKRVELHCHTKMSASDGVSEIKDIIKEAVSFGHKALAITDHGVVHAFPEAAIFVKEKKLDIKILYGMEGYLVDDTKALVTNSKGQSLDSDYVVFDLETTGLNAKNVKIIEIGAVKVRNGEIIDRFSEFVNPGEPIPYRITDLTGIRNDDVKNASTIDVILPKFREFCGDSVLVAHNAEFDTACIKYRSADLHIEWDFTHADTMTIARFLHPEKAQFSLEQVARLFSVELKDHHRAVNDAECTAGIFIKMLPMLRERGINDLDELNEKGQPTDETIKKMRQSHVTIIAKNDIGRINLYRLVSLSNLKYFKKKPKIPKSKLLEYREGLIVGSACSEGELFQAILMGRSEEELYRIASFYDYFEIMPAANDSYLLREEKYGIKTIDDIRNISRQIVALGDELKKPVVATGDVHFLNPEDEIYRRIIMFNKDFPDCDLQPPLYLHTTDEMLSEFSYLGSDKAYEVVIKNTNMIADMCERISPTRPDKCPPVIPDSDKTLRRICYSKAHELYGEELPEIVSSRLERELNSIIGNGYAVMYIIAQKLVWKSVEDGYLVGSRGSVGSSFVATMAGITEVNPLPAHYLCKNCHYSDFDSETVKSFVGRSGCDMPDKICPVCGKPLFKEGNDIPFETFLGFKGDKEPDIDLNFSGDYQNKAHKYTEVIFGEGQTFKAGTIESIADKTAFGYVKKYNEAHLLNKRSCETDRIAKHLQGVKTTTGQHPGGIVVLPMGEDINSFTPVQHPADKEEKDVITTHFDFHKIDANLLKLDILGHVDPTVIRMLEEITDTKVTDVPLDDKNVMKLFQGTEPLGLSPEDLWNTDMGTLGIPEFGTDNAMGMLKEAKPKEFSDLIRISGLSHGTNVWRGNAQDLVLSGTADISTCICTRDDIMIYLISKGLEPEESFKIMEDVRKGKVAKGKCDKWEKYKADMKEHDVPDWYIGSCEKIEYMFPKAHAAAYVMTAWRIAWYKIYMPLAYYAAFFSIRAKIDLLDMCQGKEHLEEKLNEYETRQKNNEPISATEKDSYMDMRLVHEFYARGFSFLPLDLYKSDAKRFVIEDNALRPPFSTISGMGEQASVALFEAAREKPFLSKEEIRTRGKAPQKAIEIMAKCHLIDDLPESPQISLFDVIGG